MRRWIAVLAMSGMLLVLAGCPDSDPSEEGADVAKPAAPEFELPLLDGRQIRLGDLQGKIVILDFWATWCAPCEVQMPVLNTLWKDGESREKHADDLMIVGVSVDTDPPTKVAEWVAERGFEYPIAMGSQDLAMRYGVIGFPTLVIIDPNGGIHTRHTGVWSRPEIESVLARIRLDSTIGS